MTRRHGRLGGVVPGQSVVVQGSGPVGLSVTLLVSLTPRPAGDRDRRPDRPARRRPDPWRYHHHPARHDDSRGTKSLGVGSHREGDDRRRDLSARQRRLPLETIAPGSHGRDPGLRQDPGRRAVGPFRSAQFDFRRHPQPWSVADAEDGSAELGGRDIAAEHPARLIQLVQPGGDLVVVWVRDRGEGDDLERAHTSARAQNNSGRTGL